MKPSGTLIINPACNTKKLSYLKKNDAPCFSRSHSNHASHPKVLEECKISLSIAINFISSKDNNKMCTRHSKSDNIEMMIVNKTDEINRF